MPTNKVLSAQYSPGPGAAAPPAGRLVGLQKPDGKHGRSIITNHRQKLEVSTNSHTNLETLF